MSDRLFWAIMFLLFLVVLAACAAPARRPAGGAWAPVHYPVPGHVAPGPGGMQDVSFRVAFLEER